MEAASGDFIEGLRDLRRARELELCGAGYISLELRERTIKTYRERGQALMMGDISEPAP